MSVASVTNMRYEHVPSKEREGTKAAPCRRKPTAFPPFLLTPCIGNQTNKQNTLYIARDVFKTFTRLLNWYESNVHFMCIKCTKPHDKEKCPSVSKKHKNLKPSERDRPAFLFPADVSSTLIRPSVLLTSLFVTVTNVTKTWCFCCFFWY